MTPRSGRDSAPLLAEGEAEALVERQYRQPVRSGDPAAVRGLAAPASGRGLTENALSLTTGT